MNYKWFAFWGSIAITIVLLFIIIPIPEPDRSGIFPERDIKLVYSKELNLGNPEFFIFTNADLNQITLRVSPDIYNRVKWGVIAVVLPYHGTLGENSGWHFQPFEENSVLVKEFNCTEEKPCSAPRNPEFFEFNLNEKIDSKQSYHHTVLFRFQNGSPSEPEYGYILSLNQNDEHYELGFSKLNNPKVVLALDKTADNIITAPEPDLPSSFSDKNLQRIWSLKNGITYQVDYQIPSERSYEQGLGTNVGIFSGILAIVGIGITVYFNRSRFMKHENHTQSSVIKKEHAEFQNKKLEENKFYKKSLLFYLSGIVMAVFQTLSAQRNVESGAQESNKSIPAQTKEFEYWANLLKDINSNTYAPAYIREQVIMLLHQGIKPIYSPQLALQYDFLEKTFLNYLNNILDSDYISKDEDPEVKSRLTNVVNARKLLLTLKDSE